MNEIVNSVNEWKESGEQVALATVLRTWGSAPRKAGAKMAVSRSGQMSGSVSGGCVEGAVVEEALATLQAGGPRLLDYGVSDETAWDVGLACGGQIQILVEPLKSPHFDLMTESLQQQRPAASLVVTSGPPSLIGHRLTLGQSEQPFEVSDFGEKETQELRPLVEEALGWQSPSWVQTQLAGRSVQVFIEPAPLKPELIIVGGGHISIALASLARVLDFSTIVVDPRRSFGSPERFPHADRLIQDWPQAVFPELAVGPHSAVAVLTHDPKIDDPALLQAFESAAFYIGALGSTRTQEKRRKRLSEAGVSDAQLARLHAPIGLDIGAESPEEIALAVMAEIVAARHRKP